MLRNKAYKTIKRELLRDKFLLAEKQWRKEKGDLILRYNYLLSQKSVVFDVGAYKGEFTKKISEKFGCYIYLFEPISSFYNICSETFYDNSKIKCFNFGISNESRTELITLADNSSSTERLITDRPTQEISLVCINDFCNKYNIDHISLIKLNIEGGEYDLLESIIQGGLINKINHLQIQFHNFVPNANERRNYIRKLLKKTHKEIYCYEFIWESWSLIEE